MSLAALGVDTGMESKHFVRETCVTWSCIAVVSPAHLEVGAPRFVPCLTAGSGRIAERPDRARMAVTVVLPQERRPPSRWAGLGCMP